MDNFKEVLVDCELNEIQFTRGKFTWSIGKGQNVVYERLDRGLATEGWLNLFPFSNIRHLSTVVSDHTPLLVQISNQQAIVRSKCQFRFKNMWLNDKSCRKVVDES